MSARVFLSYASPDEEKARQLHSALRKGGISCWFAPETLGPGARFGSEIYETIPRCAVFVLLWSTAAAASQHVEREIGIAANARLMLVPVKLDDTTYRGDCSYYLQQLNFTKLGDGEPSDFVARIRAALRIIDAPFPLARLYRDVADGPLDFPRHLRCIRLFIRYIALLHIAQYLRLPAHDAKTNAAIERLFDAESLFIDLDVTGQIIAELSRHRMEIHESFRGLLKVPVHALPDLKEFGLSLLRSSQFDDRNLFRLCGARDERAEGSGIPHHQALENLSRSVRGFMREVLAFEWTDVCRIFGTAVNQAGETVEFIINAPLAENLLPEASMESVLLWIETPRGRVDLRPFFSLVRRDGGRGWDLGILVRQGPEAVFETLSIDGTAGERSLPIVLPWRRLAVKRQLPPVFYANEVHSILIRLTNQSDAELEVSQIEERLPENIVSIDGLARASVSAALMMRAGEFLTLEYQVRGTQLAGSTRSFAGDAAVAYRHGGDTCTAPIDGDRETKVGALPPASVLVSRRILDSNHKPLDDDHVALDTILTVEIELRSGGAAVEEVRVADELVGCKLLDGSTELYAGRFDRLDRQQPVSRSYRVRVAGENRLSIRTVVASESHPNILVDGAERTFTIDALGPPKLTLYWRNVERDGTKGLTAALCMENTGATTAYEIAVTQETSGNTRVTPQFTGLEELPAGTSKALPLAVTCAGVAGDVVRLNVAFRSVLGELLNEDVSLQLDRVLAPDVGIIPYCGRSDARRIVSETLEKPDHRIVVLFGLDGVGKRRLLLTECDQLARRTGRNVPLYETDCALNDTLVESLTKLLESIVYEGAESEKGSSEVLRSFLREIKMDDQNYKGQVDLIETLIHSRQTLDGTWNAVALALEKTATARMFRPLVLLLQRVSKFTQAELKVLGRLQSHLASYPDIRIVVTASQPLGALELDTLDVEIDRFSDEDCRTLIGRVFIMPRPSQALENALIEKSESVPANLVSLLSRLCAESDTFLDFGDPLGVRLRDRAAFEQLPTDLLQSVLQGLRRVVKHSNISPSIVATVAALRGAFSETLVSEILGKLEMRVPETAVASALATFASNGWLEQDGATFSLRYQTMRRAFTEAADETVRERVSQALFEILQQQQASAETCFATLAEAPLAFLGQHGATLAQGLRSATKNGHYTQVRGILQRLHHVPVRLPSPYDLELRLIEQELQWEETAELDSETVDELLERIEGLPRAERFPLKVRLTLITSRWYARRREDLWRAVSVAEKAEGTEWHWGPLRLLPAIDPALEFEFHLNLWTLYYRVRAERQFCREDDWLWTRMARRSDGHHDAEAICRFLAQFREFYNECPDEASRSSAFPREMTMVFGNPLPVREHPIELRTRLERLHGSFLDEFLADPKKLETGNLLTLGRLYLDLGLTSWAESAIHRAIAGHDVEGATNDGTAAEASLESAVKIFDDAGFRFDLATARRALGEIFVDRIMYATKTGRADDLGELYSRAIKWLRPAAEGFASLNDRADSREAREVWELHADVMRRWATHQPERLDDAIRAYEDLVTEADSSQDPAGEEAKKIALIELYQQADRLDDAARVLDELKSSDIAIVLRRALVHADLVARGTMSVSELNVRAFEEDLECLKTEQQSRRPGASSGLVNDPSPGLRAAIGRIAWKLVGFYRRRPDVARALTILRDSRSEIIDAPELVNEMRQDAPALLCDLWILEGSTDEQMTQDFSTILLPVATAESWQRIQSMLDDVAAWEQTRQGDRGHLASYDMRLILAEWLIDRQRSYDAALEMGTAVLATLRAIGAQRWEQAAPLVGRGLRVVLRAEEPSRDDPNFRREFEAWMTLFEESPSQGIALRMLVHLVELLLDMHMRSRNQWYYDVVRGVATRMGTLQNESIVDFDLISRLINVYLQLPQRTPDAVDLMEKQCERLLQRRDYLLLARYLSFLSDLLEQTVSVDSEVARLLELIKVIGSGHAAASEAQMVDATPAHQSERTRVVREVARELCGDIVEDLCRQDFDRQTARHVLYNAGKLLEGEETADLRAAIYVKLYDLADRVDGACVWSAYTAATTLGTHSSVLSTEDELALTTYSNCTDEDGEGGITGNPRNYLISTKSRNRLIKTLAEERGDDRRLVGIYHHFEIRRLSVLRTYIRELPKLLADRDEFEKTAMVTFLDNHLSPGAENVPMWRKMQRIEAHLPALERDLRDHGDRLVRSGALDLESDLDPPIATEFRVDARGAIRRNGAADASMARFHYQVQTFVMATRHEGRELMRKLVERMHPFGLMEILGEVHHFLETGTRTLDFRPILGLWEITRTPAADAEWTDEAELPVEADATKLLAVLVENARRLTDEGDASVAERLYRHALDLTQKATNGDESILPRILRGLAKCLSMMGRFEAARGFAEQEIALLDKREDQDVVEALQSLVEILESDECYSEAIMHHQRIVTLTEERFGTPHVELARALNNYGVCLRSAGRPADAEPWLRRALAIDEECREPGHPIIAHRLYNLSTVLLSQDRLEEARTCLDRASAARNGVRDLVNARILLARIVIALLGGETADAHVGRLKTLLLADGSRSTPDRVTRKSDYSFLLAAVTDHALSDKVAFVESVCRVLDGTAQVADLEHFPIWARQDPVSLETEAH